MGDSGGSTSGSEAVASAFARAAEEGRAALMPYLMGAFPDVATATAVAHAYIDSGADLIELGVPFSDPLADGPVIHAAATRALDAGATLESVLETCRAVSSRIPVVLLCYANMILGEPERFARRIADAGAAGTIVPDLPLEEAHPVREAFDSEGLVLVPLIAPTTPPDRRKAIAEQARGFIYLVSSTGTTGERAQMADDLSALVSEVHAVSKLPVAVGFGISNTKQVEEVGTVASGVIIGSRLVRAVEEADDRDTAVEAVSTVVGESVDALRR
ncbi:MAG: tryptophan synthase subunit alpha [bacterium]